MPSALTAIFDAGRGAVLAGVRLEGRHEVGDVAQDEQFARAGIEDGLGRGAAVAAADDHGGGRLAAAGQLLVALGLAGVAAGHEVPVAVEQVLRKAVHGPGLAVSSAAFNSQGARARLCRSIGS